MSMDKMKTENGSNEKEKRKKKMEEHCETRVHTYKRNSANRDQKKSKDGKIGSKQNVC